MNSINHAEFMKNSDSWPQWPVLPLKRRRERGLPDCAALMEGYTGRILFYKDANIFADPSTWGEGENISAEALVAEGWVVD